VLPGSDSRAKYLLVRFQDDDLYSQNGGYILRSCLRFGRDMNEQLKVTPLYSSSLQDDPELTASSIERETKGT